MAITDPEGNKIRTRTNKRTGVTKTVVKYANPKSSGGRRDVTYTKGTPAVYVKNPQWASEDDVKKKGGATKTKMAKGGIAKKPLKKAQTGQAINKTATNGTVMSDGRTYTNRRYTSPSATPPAVVPVGTKLADGRTWDGKAYVKKGGIIKSKKK